MRILASAHWYPPFRGGGLAWHMQALLEEWMRRGHETALMCGGPVSLSRPGPRLESGSFGSVPTLELWNTPNMVGRDDDPLGHVHHPSVRAAVDEAIATFRPDVIHAFEIESLSADLLEAGVEAGIKTVVGLHNYWYLCSQRDLFRTDGSNCRDFHDGADCVTCRVVDSPGRLHVRVKHVVRSHEALGWVQGAVQRARRLAFLVRGTSRPSHPKPARASLYSERRRRLVAMLSKVDVLMPASRRVAEIHVSHGVRPRRCEPLHSVRSWLEGIEPKKPRVPVEVRFGYLGNLDPGKGVWTLLEASRGLDGRYSLHIHGPARASEKVELERRSHGLPVVIHGPYDGKEVGRIVQTIDVGVVPSVSEEALGMTALEMQLGHTPVIASRIGGLDEQVVDGETGFLFPAGDVDALRRSMQRYVDDPSLVSRHMESERPRWNAGCYVDRWEEIVGGSR